MLIQVNQYDKKRVKFTCKCGETFVKSIPEEVLTGSRQGNLALVVNDEDQTSCILVISKAVVKCPKCGDKKDLMNSKSFGFKPGQKPEPKGNQIVWPNPEDFFRGPDESHRGIN